MRGLVTNIQRYSLNDGRGIRTVVFLKGCPLRCAWCANPETQSAYAQLLFHPDICMDCGYCGQICPQSIHKGRGEACTMCMRCVDGCPTGALRLMGKEMRVEEVLEEVEKDRGFYDNSGGGLTVSGGEPLFQPEFTRELLTRAKEKHIHCAIETSGYGKEEDALRIFALCDQILFDVKHMDRKTHEKYTGASNELILKNLAQASRQFASRITVRIPLIVGVNDTESNMDETMEMCRRLQIEEIHLLPYHELGKKKYTYLDREYLFSGQTPEQEHLEQLRTKAESLGIRCKIRG